MSKDIVRPSILPGFMELVPEEQIIFNNMLDTIRRNYEKFGFLPIDTPVIEKSEVLLAKGGGETEKQVYRFERGTTDMSLRFDLTVPLARYVSQYYSELEFPFRRYQIGKVYRGERNQRGRFREFYQCDIDIVGNNKLDIKNDAEIPSIIYSTFKDLGFDSFTIRINNRKILKGFFGSVGIMDTTLVLRAIDKIDKIGLDGVEKELRDLELSDETIEKIKEFIRIKGSNEEVIQSLESLNIEDELFLQGLEELKLVDEYIELFGVSKENYLIDLTIARGLDYYTGTIYETFLDGYESIGSVCSGGRYDDLASNYSKQKLPGVGISIGLTRLFYQLMEANIMKIEKTSLTDVLVIPMKGYEKEAVNLVNKLRDKDIFAFAHLDSGKIGRKFAYADKLNIASVIVVGEEEVRTDLYQLKDMKSGDQEAFSVEDIIKRLKR